jgi:hypothetical protein
MQRKFQIFISSTFRDLVPERQDVIKNILDLRHIPAGMELFPAADTEQFEYIKKVIDQCDYYILIIGGRYGSLDADGVGYTEKEYDYAREKGLVVLAFIHGNPETLSLSNSDIKPELAEKLSLFRSKVSIGRLVQFWNNREDLENKVLKSLIHAFNDFPAEGWVRGSTVAGGEILAQINKLRNENDKLKSEQSELKRALSPQIEDIATLDDIFSVRYHYSTYPNGRARKHEEESNLSWKQIFVAVGPSFMRPSVPSVIGVKLSSYLKENKFTSQDVTILSSDLDIIKAQLIALRFFDSSAEQAKDAGVLEFLNLTQLGRSQLLMAMAVRRTICENFLAFPADQQNQN